MNATGFSLFKRGGIYHIAYTADDGCRRQKSTGCRHKPEAVRVLSDFKQFLADAAQKRSHSTISSFTTEFLPYAKSNFSKHTAYLYEKSLGHFRRIGGDLALSRITPKHYDFYKMTRLGEAVVRGRGADGSPHTVSPVTINIELRTLKAAMETAVRWRLLDANPFGKLALIAVPRRMPAFLTMEEAVRLLSAVNEDWLKDFIIFALNTGMRRGEMLALRWCDIDYEHRLARITSHDGFKVKAGLERAVALNAAAVNVIERQKRSPLHGFIFSANNGVRLTADHATKLFKEAATRAGLSKNIHLHSTRHTFASWLVGRGTSLYAVSKLLGHTSAKTSEIYAHLLPQHLQLEVEKIIVDVVQSETSNTF